MCNYRGRLKGDTALHPGLPDAGLPDARPGVKLGRRHEILIFFFSPTLAIATSCFFIVAGPGRQV